MLYLLRSLAQNLHTSNQLSFDVHPEVGQFPSSPHRQCRHFQPQTCVCTQQSSRNDTSSSLEAYNGGNSLFFLLLLVAAVGEAIHNYKLSSAAKPVKLSTSHHAPLHITEDSAIKLSPQTFLPLRKLFL